MEVFSNKDRSTDRKVALLRRMRWGVQDYMAEMFKMVIEWGT